MYRCVLVYILILKTLFVIFTFHIWGQKCLWNNGVGLLGKKCKQFSNVPILNLFFQLLIPFIQSCFALVFKIHNGTYKHFNKNSFSIFFNYISSYDFCNLYSKNFIKELYYLILKSNFWTYSCHRHSENCVAYHNMIYLGNSYLNFDFIIALNLKSFGKLILFCFILFKLHQRFRMSIREIWAQMCI